MIKEFLSHIWPTSGLYCIAVPQKTSDGKGFYYKQTIFDNISSATIFAESVDKADIDCYMAVGTLKERRYWNEKKQKYQVRVQENIHEFKSLILDIDCGKGKPYATRKEALVALDEFLNITQLPKPTLINSGGGLHVYFTFDKPVSAEIWHKFSLRLAGLASHFNLDVDSSRTCDKSSVLRVAGTHNHKQKDNPRPVKIIKLGKHTSVSNMKTAFDAAIRYVEKSGGTIDIPKKKEKELTGVHALFASVGSNVDEDFNPASAEQVVNKCNFMKQVKACGGHGDYVTEPMWRDALSISRKCAVPFPYELSTGDPNFSEAEMFSKLAWFDQNEGGPATCKRIKSYTEHNWCDKCPHSVKSPIVLGVTRASLPPPTVTVGGEEATERDSIPQVQEAGSEDPQGASVGVQALDECDLSDAFEDSEDSSEVASTSDDNPLMLETSWGEEITLPAEPYPYVRSSAGVFYQTDGEDDSIGESELIYRYDIFPWQIIDDKAGVYTVGLKVKLPDEKGDGKPFLMPYSSLADSRAFGKLIADVGILPLSTQHTERLLAYMKSYIDVIQATVKPMVSHIQLGWQDDREHFVLPNKTLNNDGTASESSTSKSIADAISSFRKKGTLEGWKEVMKVYARPGYEPHAFGHCVGYGSILLGFTEYKGGIVNIMGNTGSGKTTIAKTINTLFGHPDESMLVQHDKYLAKINRLGIFNSICVTYDEITNINSDEISDLCYSITQGRGRHRLNQNAEEKQNNTKWKLLLVSTANDSLMSKLSLGKHDSSAEAMRIFEYRVDAKHIMPKEEAQAIFDGDLYENYGHAGEVFLEYIMQNQEEVKKLITSIMVKFDKKANISIPERYWSVIVACSIAGGYISNKLNLTAFNMDSIFDWCVNQIEVMRGTVEENNTTPALLLVDFMNSHLNNTLTMSGGTSPDDKMRQDYNSQVPRNIILIRHEKDVGKAYIDRKAIGEWLKKGGADFSYVKKILIDSNIIINLNISKILATGSDMPSTGQTKCWLVDLNQPGIHGQVKIPVKENNVETAKIYELGSIDKSDNN